MHPVIRSNLHAPRFSLVSNMGMADEIKVLAGGAVQAGLIAAAPVFRGEARHEIKAGYAIGSELLRRVASGEILDIVIAPPAVVRELTQNGKVAAEGQVDVGRVGAGVVARNGAPLPDISSADALKRSLLAADSVIYNRASSGVYIDTMLKKLGVYEKIESKITRYDDGVAVMHHLMKGKGKEFGFGGITDILLYRNQGLQLVGPLPEEIQNYTRYVAALTMVSPNPDAAKVLLRYLASVEGKALFAANGIR